MTKYAYDVFHAKAYKRVVPSIVEMLWLEWVSLIMKAQVLIIPLIHFSVEKLFNVTSIHLGSSLKMSENYTGRYSNPHCIYGKLMSSSWRTQSILTMSTCII